MLFRVSPVFSSDGGAVVHFVVVQVPLQKKEGSEVRDFGFGCCRKEVCVDSLVEMITFVHWSNCSNMMSEVAYFVGVQIEDNNKNDDSHCLSPEKRQLSVVSVVKVAVRTLSMTAVSSES
ncbi:hypothetical protein JHK85_045396 [Glycine max]|nr:hypothetical protein JHK85_045396 [Glycine max]